MVQGKNIVILVLALVCVVLAGALFYVQDNTSSITAEQAGEMALEYVNDILLQGLVEAKLVGDAVKEGGLYKIELEVGGEKFFSFITLDGKTFFPQGINMEDVQEPVEDTGEETIGFFSISTDEVCLENGKPIVYFFGSELCPHCTWEHPIMEQVAAKFGDAISFHNNMDNDADRDVFSKYSTGGIPATVIGCRYYRVGSGERMGEEENAKALTTLICDITNGEPLEVCETVDEIVD